MSRVFGEGITDQELDELRDAQETFQTTKVIIRRREFFPPDDYDHRTTVAKDVNARISAGFGQFRGIADRYQGITPFTITLAWDQDIRADDEVIDPESRVFQIRDVKANQTYHTATQCLADLINDNA